MNLIICLIIFESFKDFVLLFLNFFSNDVFVVLLIFIWEDFGNFLRGIFIIEVVDCDICMFWRFFEFLEGEGKWFFRYMLLRLYGGLLNNLEFVVLRLFS